MRKLSGFLSFFFILLALPTSKLTAQNIKISGTVISLTGGYPIRGATVIVVGSARGTFTDSLGRYELVTPSLWEATTWKLAPAGFLCHPC